MYLELGAILIIFQNFIFNIFILRKFQLVVSHSPFPTPFAVSFPHFVCIFIVLRLWLSLNIEQYAQGGWLNRKWRRGKGIKDKVEENMATVSGLQLLCGLAKRVGKVMIYGL